MDFDDIKFTEWQIDKIRVALNKYRIARARNARLLPWIEVLDDITSCEENNHLYSSEQDAERIFKPEALRRFAAGTSLLKVDRLKDITRFFLYERILSLRDLDESMSEMGELLALHQYLANNSDQSKKYISKLDGTYVVHKEGEDKSVVLKLIPDVSMTYLRVEEVFISGEAGNRRDRRINTTRIGYGFAVTPLNVLHIFLNGVVPDSKITYVQAGELYDDAPENGVFLMRNGEPTARTALPLEFYSEEPIELSNIYRFLPEMVEEMT